MDDVWDKLALLHYRRLSEGTDITFHKIFLPVILEALAQEGNAFNILDVGCGTGFLTGIISRYSHSVIGLDTSQTSIDIAKQHNQNSEKVHFELVPINQFSEAHIAQFDFVISHLVLHVIEDLDATLQSISKCLKTGGGFLFSIPHPSFWALTGDAGTWNFSKINDYDYYINSSQKNSIMIGNEHFSTPHFHRALTTYSSSLNKSGFIIERITEPFPDHKFMQENNKKPWTYPRFLFMLCRKTR